MIVVGKKAGSCREDPSQLYGKNRNLYRSTKEDNKPKVADI